jgi:hypothetical protein
MLYNSRRKPPADHCRHLRLEPFRDAVTRRAPTADDLLRSLKIFRHRNKIYRAPISGLMPDISHPD